MSFNMSEIDSLLSSNEIDKLLFEFKAETSVFRKKPSDIKNNSNEIERESELLKFKLLDELYVFPLFVLANRINMKLYNKPIEFQGMDNLSIIGRMFKIKEFLVSKGCSIDNIMDLVPRTANEIIILINAKNKGFDLGYASTQSLTNEDRVKRAQEYLDAINNIKRYNGNTR